MRLNATGNIDVSNYNSEIDDLKSKIHSLNLEISKLQNTKKEILSENHSIFEEKRNKIERIIVEEHEIKAKIMFGLGEVNEKNKIAEETLILIKQDRLQFDKKMEEFNLGSERTKIILKNKEDELIEKEKSLEVLNNEINLQNIILKEAQSCHAKEVVIFNAKKIIYDTEAKELSESYQIFRDREQILIFKENAFLESNKKFSNELYDFENKKKILDKNLENISKDKIEISLKTSQNNEILIQNSKIFAENLSKLESINKESRRIAEQIMELENLRNQLIKQGEKNVIATSV